METKLDRLFQEKLARHEVEPTPDAWDKVSAEISESTKSRGMVWLSIAASVIFLAVSAYLVLRPAENVQLENFTAKPDQPNPLTAFQWNIPEIQEKIEVKKETKHVEVVEQKREKTFAYTNDNVQKEMEQLEEQDQIEIPELPIVEPIENAEAFASNLDEDPVMESALTTLPQFQVQITYKAGEAKSQTDEEKTKVRKLWEKARQIKPGEMLASIRETKNDFFNGKKN